MQTDFSCVIQHLSKATLTKKQSRCYHGVRRNHVPAGDRDNVPQHVLYKLWTLWKCPSCTEGSCTCTGSAPCPWLEQSLRSCHAAPPGPHHLPPGNTKPHTWQVSTGTHLPSLPVIFVVIPLLPPPNKCSREWEHPSVFVPLSNMIQTLHSPWNPAPVLELSL